MNNAAGDITVPSMPRPTRCIAGIAVLEFLSYPFTNIPSIENLAISLLIGGFLVWRIWYGSDGAWFFLLLLNAAYATLILLVLFNVTGTSQDGPWLFWRAATVGGEVWLLLTPRMRQWVSTPRGHA